jgi:PEP-CTERM motif
MRYRFPSKPVKCLFLGAGLALVAQMSQAADDPTTILFIGNSFTHGNYQPTLRYNAANVHDLNGSGYGGVPGIFKKLTDEAGLNYDVSIEAVSGQSLQYHYNNKLSQIGSASWDDVVMHDYSTLNASAAGNPSSLYQYSKALEQYIHAGSTNANANADADVYLMETWARADQVYNTPGGFWNGTSIEKMGGDLHDAYYNAAAMDPNIEGVIPVGDSFLRAVHSGVADSNPYDGIDSGKVNLWNVDSYHASAWGSYLEALTIYGQITGLDPRSVGGADGAASDLGISSSQAIALQNIAFEQLQVAAVPEPETYALMLAGLGIVGWVAAKRKRSAHALAA